MNTANAPDPMPAALFNQTGRQPVSIATYALDTLALLVLGHAMANLLLIDEMIAPALQPQGNTVLQALNFLVYLFYGLRLLLEAGVKQQLRQLLQSDRLFWFSIATLLVLAFVSALWSSEPYVALRRAIAISGTSVVGCYLALRYTPRQFLALLLGLSAVFAVASLAMVVLWPAKGLMHQSMVFPAEHEGRWRGIFLHKNHLGSLMAAGIVIAAGTLHGHGRQLLATGLILLSCIGVLLAAESLTALLAAAAGLLLVALLRVASDTERRRRNTVLALAPIALLALLTTLYQYARMQPEVMAEKPAVVEDARSPARTQDIAAAATDSARVASQREGFRRDATATGRLGIWRLCAEAIQLQPLQGYGYGTFWRSGGPAEMVWQKTTFHTPHAHNGWIDLTLQLGLPATLLIALWMLWLGIRLWRWIHTATDAPTRSAAIALLGLWGCLNVVNLAETVLFREHELLTSLLIAIAVFASQASSAQSPGSKARNALPQQPAITATSAR